MIVNNSILNDAETLGNQLQFSPLVSIVIPVHNGANYLREAIDSALNQTYKNIEVLVVNDGSEDDGKTRDIALSYGDRIRYFEKENGGVSTALNLGIQNMKGEYFSWLSHDDIYLPRKIQASIDALAYSDDKTKSVCCKNEWIYMPDGIIRQEPWRFAPEKYLKYGILTYLFTIPTGCALLIHQSYFKRYGLFDTTKRCVQDSLQWFKFYKHNDLIYISEILVQVRIHPEQDTVTSPFKRKEQSDWLVFIVDNIKEEDLSSTGWSLYLCFSFLLTKYISSCFYKYAYDYVVNKMKQIDDFKDYEKENTAVRNIMLGTNRTILYCAGNRLKEVSFNFILRGIQVAGFSDSDVQKLTSDRFGISPILPNKLNKETDCIVITKVNPEDVKAYLMLQGFKHVYTYDEDFFRLFVEIPIKKEFLDEYEKWL